MHELQFGMANDSSEKPSEAIAVSVTLPARRRNFILISP